MKLFFSPYERIFRLGLMLITVVLMTAGTESVDGSESAKILRPNGSQVETMGAAVAMEGNLLVVGAPHFFQTLPYENGVFLYDVTNPSNPVFLSELIPTDGPHRYFGQSVALSGNLVLVGSESSPAKCHVFDISDAQNPVQRSILTPSVGNVFGYTVAMSGNLAVVGGTDTGVHIFDLSNPANPMLESVIDIAQDLNSGLAISGDVLVIGKRFTPTSNRGVAILYDISDPKNPVQESYFPQSHSRPDGAFGSAVVISGNTVFIGQSGYGSGSTGDRRGAVHAYDISDPSNPIQKSSIFPLGTPPSETTSRAGTTLAVRGSELLVGGAWSTTIGIAVLYDYSDVENPVEKMRFFPSDSTGDFAAFGFGHEVAYNGRTAVIGAPLDKQPGITGNIGSANVFVTAQISIPDLEDSSDTGTFDSDNLTREVLPTFSGQSLAGLNVELVSDVDGSLGSVTATAGGTWSITVSSPLSEGVHQITATDGAGFATDPLTVTIDTTPPAAPTSLDLIDMSDTGQSNTDNITKLPFPTFAGSAGNGDGVTLYSDLSGNVGSGASDGSFSIKTSQGMGEGDHTVTATATDAAGNESAASVPLVITIDLRFPRYDLVQSTGQADPTDMTPIVFDLVFDETVFGVADDDVVLGGSAGATTKTVTELAPHDGTTFRVDVGGVQGDGIVRATLEISPAEDLAGNPARPDGLLIDNEVLFDAEIPSVTIDQAPGQADPANASPVRFQVVFSEEVTGFAPGDVILGGTAGATTVGITGDGSIYEVTVSGMTGDGTVTATIGADAAQDGAGKGNTASTSTDNGVIYDTTAPGVTINQAAGQADPAVAAPVNFTVVFSEPVSGFAAGDVNLGGNANPTAASISEIAPNDSTTFNVAVSGMSRDGLITASIGAGAASDAAGNASAASTSSDNVVAYDVAAPSVIVAKAFGQSDPTDAAPVRFVAFFSEPVTGFDGSDVTLTGTAGATTAVVTPGGSMDGATYNIAVSGMNATGSVTVTIGAGVAVDQVGKPNSASTSSDDSVEFFVDLHGGTRASATGLVFSGGNASRTGSLFGNDLDYFEFELTEPLHVSIFTEGSLDTEGKLFDEAGALLGTDDDGGSGDNFRIGAPLPAGTYFVEVSGKGGNQEGTYTLRVEQGSAARVQPDNRIGKSLTDATGDNVYAGTQSRKLISKKGRRVQGVLGIENDGEVADDFKVTGTRGTKLFKITYTGPKGNATAAITAGSYRTGTAQPGATPHRVSILIKPKRSKLKKKVGKGRKKRVKWLKKRLTIQLTSASQINGAAKDGVTLFIKTK